MGPGQFSTVDDQADGYVLMFGATQWYGQLETWAFANGSWRELSPKDSPSNVLSDGLVYDAAAEEVIGTGITAYNSVDHSYAVVNQTWGFHSGNWAQVKTIGAPPTAYDGQLAYDSNDNSVVLFGGYNASSSTWLNETSIYQNGTWTEASPSVSPPTRSGFALASDPSSGAVLLFGGMGTVGSNDFLNDSWIFDDGAWTNVTAAAGAAPSGRSDASISADPSLSKDVLFGGVTLAYEYVWGSNETWTFANGTWQNVSPIFPPETRFDAAFSFDPASGDMLLYGGCAWDCYYDVLDDSWIFGAFAPPIRINVWSTPAQPAPGTLVSFNSSVVGGAPPYSYNWSFADGSPDSGSQNTAHRFAATGDFYVHLTVSDSVYSTVGSTDLISVTNVTPMTGQLSIRPTLAYVEQSVGTSVAVAGGRLPFLINWSFGDGTPDYSYSSSYSGDFGGGHYYARPGSFTINVSVADAIGDSVSESGIVIVAFPPAPFLASIETNRTTGPPPLSVSFVSIIPPGVIPMAYSWSFGDGSPDASTPSVNHTFQTAGLFVVQLTIVNSTGGSSTSSIIIEATSAFPPPAPLQVVLSAAPASSAAGGVATFVASTLGGSSPYSFNWSGLPAGCPTVDTPTIRCTLPDYAADVVVIVNVVDASGERADATASVTVLPPASPPESSNTTSIILQGLPPGFWWLMGAVAATSIACAAIAVSLAWRRPASRIPPQSIDP